MLNGFNGDSGYSGCGGDMACTVTGVEMPGSVPPGIRWFLPVTVWNWS